MFGNQGSIFRWAKISTLTTYHLMIFFYYGLYATNPRLKKTLLQSDGAGKGVLGEAPNQSTKW